MRQNHEVDGVPWKFDGGLGGGQGVFPKGIVIGAVQAVGKDAGATRTVKVRPAVDFGRLEEAYVLR